MDQRVDSERRTDFAPGQEARPARGGARKPRALLGALRERRALSITAMVGGVVVVLAVLLWWLHARNYETTDDAFIDTRTVQISAQVAAAIVGVPVTDNQLVDAGAELIRLDDRDYIAQRDAAKATADNLKAQIDAQQAKIVQAEKLAAQAQAALIFAQQEAERYEQLAKQGTATVEQAQQYSSNMLQA